MPRTAEDVRDFLKSELRKKVLVPDDKEIPDDAHGSFEKAKLSSDDSRDASILLYDKLQVRSTENGNQSTWEKTTDRIFEILLGVCEQSSPKTKVEITRNAASMGSSFTSSRGGTKRARTSLDGSRLRADFAVLIDDVLVFMTEEKPTSTTEAVNDIKNKLVWTTTTHGQNLPYLLAMSSAGTKAQFFVVESGTLSDRVKPVSDLFDISDSGQRFAFVRHVINCARLSRKLRELIGASRRPVHVPAGRDGVVTLFANGAIKHVPFKTVKDDQKKSPHVVKKTLEALYAPKRLTEEFVKGNCVLNGLPNCVQVELATVNDDGLLLTLTPRAETVAAPKPGNDDDRTVAVAALRDVLKALKALHEKDWVHRDIRWPNILRVKDENGNVRYILIDFEYASESGAKVTWTKDKHQPNEARTSKGADQVGWTAKHDLWQVGALLAPIVNNDNALKTACLLLQKLSDDASVIEVSYSALNNITLS
mmetsp:Transcript_9732/g.29505  ORF Transcript_9732/g.29505 Transcript_9732/m.29505 type:complete len:479 (-) Transcript_9732:87-1523(-)